MQIKKSLLSSSLFSILLYCITIFPYNAVFNVASYICVGSVLAGLSQPIYFDKIQISTDDSRVLVKSSNVLQVITQLM